MPEGFLCFNTSMRDERTADSQVEIGACRLTRESGVTASGDSHRILQSGSRTGLDA